MKYPAHTILDIQNRYVRKQYLTYKFLKLNEKYLPLTYSKTLNWHTYFPPFNTKKCALSFNRTQSLSLSWITLCDLNFLRKEKIYTKLKYSRCPQYDIISGGFAAIFAGFIGFLISEKFGIELVDSGDFYIALMYGIFSIFSMRPLLRMYSITSTPYAPYSLKYGVLFWLNFCNLVLNGLRQLYSKFFM